MLWLIGMMGSGKSTVAAILAAVTGTPMVDTDELVELMTGYEIEELFEEGEDVFRAAEAAAVAKTAAGPVSVVATGGGVVLSEANVSTMSAGTIIWLQASLSELIERIGDTSSRPLLADGNHILTQILKERQDTYAAAAEFVVETDGLTAVQVAQGVLELWRR